MSQDEREKSLGTQFKEVVLGQDSSAPKNVSSETANTQLFTNNPQNNITNAGHRTTADPSRPTQGSAEGHSNDARLKQAIGGSS
ncbi:hypothetical protein HDV00_002787 [Rhizophlyctis rosea]|nr:hypothetical protein HDV00_002787 [Rhizophlyctis rosea]